MFNKSVIKLFNDALKQIENAHLFKYEISKSYFYIFSNIEMLKENFSRISYATIFTAKSFCGGLALIGIRESDEKVVKCCISGQI